MMRRKRELIILAAAIGFAALVLSSDAPARPAETPGAVSAAACIDCHDGEVASFSRSPHAAVPLPEGAEVSCAACHGDVKQHLDDGGGTGNIFSFGEGEMASKVNQTCESCHASAHPRFTASPHGGAGMSCISCHSVHSPAKGHGSLLKVESDSQKDIIAAGSASATCAECHGEVFAQFQYNERHRLREGILDCTSCHNPHEPQQRLALGGLKQEMCVGCHTDKVGPYIFEHPSLRVEGCVACHSPHGSPNRHMLNFQSTAELCFSCHNAVPGFHSRFTTATNCTNCHSSIHGSNFDSTFLK